MSIVTSIIQLILNSK